MRLAKRALPFAICLAVGALLSSVTHADSGAVRIHGVVSLFDGTTLTIKADSGKRTLIGIPPATHIAHRRMMSLGDIGAGDFVGALSLKDATGKLRAQAVRLYPNTAEAPGEGQYPMDSNPARLVTNGTVSAVSAADGKLTLVFHGASLQVDGGCTGRPPAGGAGCSGSADLMIARGVPIVAISNGDTSLFRAGAIVTVVATPDPSSLLTATSVTVERDDKPAQ